MVLGADTHRDVHAAAVLSLVGSVIGIEVFTATAAGYLELLEWARGLGTARRAGVEGAGFFGAALYRPAWGSPATARTAKTVKGRCCRPGGSIRVPERRNPRPASRRGFLTSHAVSQRPL
ncbi:hypothetical protein Sliba_78650 [Streptomyces nigrescens]|uniref:Uncharacterized protein n=1 Tax=Streptomyces nigrescens TaxID=1920 RepID=A0A640TX20_STRNI|nr:hypothetical protein Sliba_78650 [Streptomyces libani subsp. libani]GGV96209.1 hypothetical protein GCM10010500_38420 [Streptomyces libani subsp. libani]